MVAVHFASAIGRLWGLSIAELAPESPLILSRLALGLCGRQHTLH